MILDENQSSTGFFSLFHDSWNAFPTFVIIDHTMTVYYKTNQVNSWMGNTKIQEMLDACEDDPNANCFQFAKCQCSPHSP